MVKDASSDHDLPADRSPIIVDSAQSNNEAAAVDVLEQEFIAKCSLQGREKERTSDDSSDQILGEPCCGCVWPVPSLVRGSSDCQIRSETEELRIPVVTPPYLALNFAADQTGDEKNELSPYPSQASPILSAILTNRKRLTKEGAAKHKYEITLDLEASSIPSYEPGDAFYFIVPNVSTEVQWLLRRLNLDEVMAAKRCSVSVREGTTKKNAKVPPHLNQPRSISYMLTNLVDIRGVVSKALLRYMADTCTNSDEKRRLLELVCVQGAAEFEQFVRTPRLSVLDILHAFPSCMPTIERLLEYLSPLSPRAYSVASYTSPTTAACRQMRFVFSRVTIPAGNGRFYRRGGLATSWLTNRAIGSQERIFLKKTTKFRLLPEHGECPILMIGPGAGLAPFIGFLQRIMEEKRVDPTRFSNVWLLFGCKNEKLDFLYREDLEKCQSSGILSRFHVSFSRDNDDDGELSLCRYVHDIIRRYGEEISKLFLEGEANSRVYVCGDAKNLVNDVSKAFCDVLSTHAGKSESEARDVLKKMQLDGRYLQDVWA